MIVQVDRRRELIAALLAGSYATAVAIAPSITTSSILILPVVAAPILFWLINSPTRWLYVFLATAILLPPLPISIGNSGPHPALLVAAIGIAIGLLRFNEWRIRVNALSLSMLVLFAILLISIAPAIVFSGPEIAAASLARVFLFGISVFIFLYAQAGPGSRRPFPIRTAVRWLFFASVLAAAYAAVDFYFQFPTPGGFGPQFVWLDSGVYRRAQGLFYEASTLGNFCAFFLILIAHCLLRPAPERPINRWLLLAGGGVLALALILSYSRASVLNCLVALAVLLYLNRGRVNLRRIAIVGVGSAAGGALLAWILLPEFARLYWLRLSGSAQFFFSATEGVLSGRVASWRFLSDVLAEHPWFLLTGVGYKTLPYSEFLGQTAVGDNMYLTLLVETGIAGLAALVVLLTQVIRFSWRAAQSPNPRAAFLGVWLVSFWAGQCVQMLSGDLLTYWRTLPIYFWILALAVRETET